MNKDLADYDRVDDEADESSLAFAFGTEQDVVQENPLDEWPAMRSWD